MIHTPWTVKFDFDPVKHKEVLTRKFETFVNNRKKCPPSVCLACAKAKETFLSRNNEPVATEQSDVYQMMHDSDEEINDCVDLCNMLYRHEDLTMDDTCGFEHGHNYDWHVPRFQVSSGWLIYRDL